MDNRSVDITSEGNADLSAALRLIWPNAAGGKAVGYTMVNLKEEVTYYGEPCTHHFNRFVESVGGTPTLILYWHEHSGGTPLPYAMGELSTLPFIQGWLNDVDYGRQPDHDGSNGKGWRVFHIPDYSYSFVAIQPVWAWYGK